MNEETKQALELIKEYHTKRVGWEIRMGEEEIKLTPKGTLTINDKISNWKKRLKRLNAQFLYFCEDTLPKQLQAKPDLALKIPSEEPITAP